MTLAACGQATDAWGHDDSRREGRGARPGGERSRRWVGGVGGSRAAELVSAGGLGRPGAATNRLRAAAEQASGRARGGAREGRESRRDGRAGGDAGSGAGPRKRRSIRRDQVAHSRGGRRRMGGGAAGALRPSLRQGEGGQPGAHGRELRGAQSGDRARPQPTGRAVRVCREKG